MTRAEMLEAVRIGEELERRKAGRKLDTYYPDNGPLRRELYPKHLEFFRLGAEKRERLFLAANRIGKTEGAGGYEATLHLTGNYPKWWQGRRFNRPVTIWAAGDTRQTVRDSIQKKLLGPPGNHGTGLIPRESLARVANASGIPDAVETVWVKHASGGISVLGFKSYDQGRASFQATEQDLVWLDEEPPMDVYTECLLRTMTNNGQVVLTFTPLLGMSAVVQSFLPGGVLPEKQDGAQAVVSATWDDVPHLTETAKAEMLARIPPFQREARSKGLPQLGAGLIYPVPESTFIIDPFEIPKHWPRAYGLDVGWKKTAAIFGAYDRETDTAYIYSEHYQGESEPAVHAAAIKARGLIPGAIDPASRGRTQTDGKRLIEEYRGLGLELTEAANAVEAGLLAVWNRLSTGRLKIMRNVQNLLAEMRLYRRDEKGKVVKENDHACLAPGTMVETRDGPRPVDALVGTEGEVLTTSGAWARYRNARLTRRAAPVVLVAFEDGRAVTCTPDHRFLTERGWKEARELVGHSVYDAVAQRIQRTQWTQSSSPRPVRSLLAAATTCAASISNAMAFAFTALCGALRTDASRRAPTFITGTRIAATTPSPTSNSFWPGLTPSITMPASREVFRPQRVTPQEPGTPAPKAESGTSSTTRGTGRSCTRSISSDASSAASMLSLAQARRDSVPTRARPSGASWLASTTRNALASFAARLMWRIATRRSGHARASALSRCSSVTATGSSDVYCLEVPGARAFAVAGGLVVHNCDALRYFEMTGIDIARAPAPLEPKVDPEFVYSFGGGGTWMG
jgi:phage terminase large subunit-like protein